MKQEEVPLSDKFQLALVLPSPAQKPGRARSGSLSSVATFDVAKMRFVTGEQEWEELVGSPNAPDKLTLRIFENSG